MKLHDLIVPMCLFACSVVVPMHAQQSYVVRVRDGGPTVLSMPSATPLIPPSVVRKFSERQQSLEQRRALDVLQRYVVVRLTAAQVDSLRQLPWIEDISVNHRIPVHEAVTNDSLSAEQWALPKIGAPAAWKKATGRGVTVGILDTGIDWDHEDLVGRFAINTSEDANRNGRFEPWSVNAEVGGVSGDLDGVDNDGNGYVDDVIGYDFVDQDVRNLGDDRERDAIPYDEQGHGTSVAGVVGATANNKKGIAGLAYNCGLVALRAFDATGNAEEDDVAAALLYAALNNVNVVNMSFGDVVDSPVIRDAVRAAAAYGCVLVSSAGNSGTTSRQYPAGYADVIAVASTSTNDQRSPFSSTGSLLALSAPGQAITTTAVGSAYRTVQGTSFSSPYVAAAAALLLEARPGLSANEIRGILSESSVDLGDRGWDVFFGAGRLQVDAALSLAGSSVVRIDAPLNEQEIDVKTTSAISVVGTATSTSFKLATVDIGQGIEPTSWTTIQSLSTQRVNDVLASIPTSSFPDGSYTIRLRVELQNGRTVESRRRVTLASLPPSITSLEIVDAWQDDRMVPVLTLRVSRPSAVSVRYAAKGSSAPWQTRSDTRRLTRTHSFTMDDLLPGVEYDLVVTAVTSSGDSVQTTSTFTPATLAAPTTGWRSVTSPPLVGYVLNDVRALYTDNKPSFVMNDMSSGTFGRIRSVVYEPSTFEQRDSGATLIPRGMGDSNGDGIIEVLCHVVGKTYLYQAAQKGGSPFSRLLYADTMTNTSAAAMADITGDGREELFMFNDSGMVAYTFRNGSYARLATAVNTSAPPPGVGDNRYDEISCAIGDMDGDGAPELVYADTDGDILFFTFDGTTFLHRSTRSYEGAGGSGYVYGADVDGDGRMEVVFGVPDSTLPNSEQDYGRDLWTYRMFKATSDFETNEVWSTRFNGVRYGIGYRNGIDGGQLDMKGGSEVMISAFPRLYVFSWDAATATMQPQLYMSDVATSRALVHDFDGNGINELGVCVTSDEIGYATGMVFVEKDTNSVRIPTPVGLRAELRADSSVMLRWNSVQQAAQYNIQRTVGNGAIFRTFDSTATNSIVVDSLLPRTLYRYRVVAVPMDASRQESFRSNVVEVRYEGRTTPRALNPASIEDTVAQRGISLALTYSGRLPSRDMEPTTFTLVSPDGRTRVSATSAIRGGDSTVVVAFKPMRIVEGLWTLQCGVMRDANGAPTQEASLPLTVRATAPPQTFYLRSLRVVDRSTAVLAFSEDVPAENVQNIASYTIRPSGAVRSVSVLSGDSVELHFDPSQPLGATGRIYYLTVYDMTARSGRQITTAEGNTLGMVFTAADLSDVYVFPHPVHITTDPTVTFANLTDEAEIEVFDQNFTSLILLKTTDANGGLAWNMIDAKGNVLPPGLYFYRVRGTTATGDAVESPMRKLMLQR